MPPPITGDPTAPVKSLPPTSPHEPGLFITTGTFSPAAVKEATRDGAPPIDLVDGSELAEKLKELGLGVRTEMIEAVNVDEGWFESV
jgi:restriction system protein